jgi:hypothetical protein
MWKRGVNKTIPDSFLNIVDLQENPEKLEKHVSRCNTMKFSIFRWTYSRANLCPMTKDLHCCRTNSLEGDHGHLLNPNFPTLTLTFCPALLHSTQFLNSNTDIPFPCGASCCSNSHLSRCG